MRLRPGGGTRATWLLADLAALRSAGRHAPAEPVTVDGIRVVDSNGRPLEFIDDGASPYVVTGEEWKR